MACKVLEVSDKISAHEILPLLCIWTFMRPCPLAVFKLGLAQLRVRDISLGGFQGSMFHTSALRQQE